MDQFVLVLVMVVEVLVTGRLVLALDNGLARIPPMGWMSRQRFGCNVDCTDYPNDCISERLVKSMADAIVDRGLLDVGYKYVVIDDCWMDLKRDSGGNLQGDLRRFPSGMANVIKYVHSKGLKFGLYVGLGNRTCGGFPGSFGRYSQDAETLAVEWKVDFVKASGCGLADIQLANAGYVKFGEALNKTGLPVVYSCDWPNILRHLGGQANMSKVMATCNQFRTYDDTKDNWENLVSILKYFGNYNPMIRNFSRPGSFNDPDQLVIGDFGLSVNQQQMQMSIWSMMSAPLFVSADLRVIRRESLDILTNKLALIIDQDPIGNLGVEVKKMGDVHLWLKPMKPTGSFGIGIFYINIAGGPSRVSVRLSDIGLTTAGRYKVTEAFSGRSYGTMKPWYTLNCEVNPNGSLLYTFIAIS